MPSTVSTCVTVRLDNDYLDHLGALAERLDVSRSSLVNGCVGAVLERIEHTAEPSRSRHERDTGRTAGVTR